MLCRFAYAFLAIGGRRLDMVELAIERLDHVADDARGRNAPGRMIAGDLAILIARRHMAEHPVMIAALRRIDDIGKDLIAIWYPVPKHLEDAARHVAMADHVMGLPHHLALVIVGDFEKGVICVGDTTLEIRFADDQVVFIEEYFCAWIIHSISPLIKQIPEIITTSTWSLLRPISDIMAILLYISLKLWLTYKLK